MSNIYRRLMLVIALSAGLALSLAASASDYFPSLRGTIDSIDFLKHTISVNNHTYPVSSKASYTGAQGFGVLSQGMNIEYFLEDLPGGGSEIVAITVLQR